MQPFFCKATCVQHHAYIALQFSGWLHAVIAVKVTLADILLLAAKSIQVGQIETWFVHFAHGQQKFHGFNFHEWLRTCERHKISPSQKLPTIWYFSRSVSHGLFIISIPHKTAKARIYKKMPSSILAQTLPQSVCFQNVPDVQCPQTPQHMQYVHGYNICSSVITMVSPEIAAQLLYSEDDRKY